MTVFLKGVGPSYLAGRPDITGSITGPDPGPAGMAVQVSAGVRSLETGVLTAWPGLLAGLYQLPVKMPAPGGGAGVQAVLLLVAVAGVPAAPFAFYDRNYQIGGLVWMAP